jgi:hypothetical protein
MASTSQVPQPSTWVRATPDPDHQNFVNSGDYTGDRRFLDFGGRPAYDVGWKLHVVKPNDLDRYNSYLPMNYKRLLSYLRDQGIPHKIVRNLDQLAQMEQTPSQVGKFITIYPNSSAQLRSVANQIEVLISENATNPRPPNDLNVGARGLVSARWGGLTSVCAVDNQNGVVYDNRNISHPGWVLNPFDPQSQGQDAWQTFDEQQNKQVKIMTDLLLRQHARRN